MKYQVHHPRAGFSGISYGQKFVNGTFETTNPSLTQRFRTLGFQIRDIPEVVPAPMKTVQVQTPEVVVPKSRSALKASKKE